MRRRAGTGRGTGTGDGGYAFGDGTTAARRLDLVAELAEPSSRAFLEGIMAALLGDAAPAPALAVDLGCGPGHTTRLLAAVLRPRRMLGLDQSPSFVARARQRQAEAEAAARTAAHTAAHATAHGEIAYAVHDVTATPFPETPVDLAYSRFLVTHLRDPAAALRGWASQLRPGGWLLIDEVEEIHTDQPALRRYLDVVDALLAAHGHHLDAGRLLDRLPDSPALTRRATTVRPRTPELPRIAEMFGLNLAVWRADPLLDGIAGQAELDELAGELDTLAQTAAEPAGAPPAGSITWGFRQISYQRLQAG